jgi:hypothetical protein
MGPDAPPAGRTPPEPTPPSLTELAEVLRAGQATVLGASEADGLRQVGAVVLPEPFPVPVPVPGDPVHPGSGPVVIETFLVDEGGRCEPTGSTEAIGAWWLATAQSLVDRVLAAVSPLGWCSTAPPT